MARSAIVPSGDTLLARQVRNQGLLARQEVKASGKQRMLNGRHKVTVSRDFRPSVFSLNNPPGP
jgi:hypothetical protein